MNTLDRLQQRIAGLLRTPREELNGWARLLQRQAQLWRFCARQLRRNNALAMSAALSFRSIFAMVPTLVLAFLMLKSLGFVGAQKQLLDDFIRQLGLDRISYTNRPGTLEARTLAAVEAAAVQAAAAPAAGMSMTFLPAAAVRGATVTTAGREVTVAGEITSLIEQVEQRLTVGALGPIGVALLIWTALALLMTIERSLNRVFEASRARSPGRRVLLYWSVLTLAPLLVLLASLAADKAGRAVQDVPVIGWMMGPLGWIAALIVGAGVLAFIYQLMPNTGVPLRAAATGAAVAFPLWLVARWALALYVGHVAGKSVYGALGLIPLFLMWLNASWWIFLFGAQLAHTAANLDRMAYAEQDRAHLWGPWDMLAAVVAVARINAARSGPVSADDVAAMLAGPRDAVDGLLRRLASAGMIYRVADAHAYLPATPADHTRVADILRVDCAYADPQTPPGQPEIVRAVRGVLARSEAGIENLTVADIIHA